MMNNLTLPAIFAATLDSGLRRNDSMGFACLRATHRQAGMTVDNLVGGSPQATPSQQNGTYRPGIPLLDQ